MKKYQKFMMVLTLALFGVMLTGCFGGDDDYNGQDSTTNNNNNNNQTTSDYVRGTRTGTNNFASEFLNLRFTTPAGFILLDDDEMEDLLGISMEYVLGDDGLTNFAQAMLVYEMVATNPLTGNSAQVIVERMISRNISMEDYLEASRDQFMRVFPNAEFSEAGTKEFAGETYTYFSVKSSAFGMDMNQKSLIRQIDNRMVVIMFTIVDGNDDDLEIMLNGFREF